MEDPVSHLSASHCQTNACAVCACVCVYIDGHVGGSWLTSSLEQLDLPPPLTFIKFTLTAVTCAATCIDFFLNCVKVKEKIIAV